MGSTILVWVGLSWDGIGRDEDWGVEMRVGMGMGMGVGMEMGCGDGK